MYIAWSPTWTATTSVSNVRTTLLTLELRSLPEFSLPYFSFRTGSASAYSSTSGDMTQTLLSQSYRTSLRYSSYETLVTHKPLWTFTQERSRRTPSTSKKKFSTGQPTWKNCKRSSKSLIPLQPRAKRSWPDTSWKAWNIPSRPR